MKELITFVPILIFFYLYKTTPEANHQNLMVATQGLIAAVVVVYGILFVVQKWRLDKTQWITLALTVLLGGATLLLRDDFYIKMKAPLINLVFAFAFALSPLFGKQPKPLIQRMFGPVFELTAAGWSRLNWIWVGFFVIMAGLQALFAFVWSQYWAEFTAFGDMALMFAFIIIQIVILRKYIKVQDHEARS